MKRSKRAYKYVKEELEKDSRYIKIDKDFLKSFKEPKKVSSNALETYLNIAIDDDFLVQLSKPQYRLRKNVLSWEFINNNYTSIIYGMEQNALLNRGNVFVCTGIGVINS